MELRKGDLVEVQWLDIYEDVAGDPEQANLAPRVSVGYVWGVKDSHGIPALVTTTTMDTQDVGQNGYCIYPLAAVAGIQVIRRGKGKAYREQPSFAWNEHQADGPDGGRHDRSGDAGKRRRKGKVRGAGDQPSDLQEVPQVGEPQAPAVRNGGAGSNGG